MSGRETDDDTEATQGSCNKAIVHIPVCWLNPQVVEMLHTVEMWMQLEKDEDEDCHGNRPLKKNTWG